MKVNINEQVKIKLTDSGKEVYSNYLSQFNSPSISKMVPDELTLPLWEFAQIFGSELYMGQVKAPFFENNEIEFVSFQ
jgi:hypothetical protein